MKYLHSARGGVITLLIFALAAFFIDGEGPNQEVEIILTISTFLFAIMSGFLTSRLNFRYNKITSLIATEDAYWLVLFKTATTFCEQNFANRIREIVDKYYITTYDFELGNYYKHNAKYIHAIYGEMVKLNTSKYKKTAHAFDSILDFLGKIEENRKKGAVLSLEKITGGQWLIVNLLAAIIIFCIFYLKTPVLYSQIISVILSTITILIVLIARDLQNLRLGGKALLAESGQENFEFMGKLRYYNAKHLKNGCMSVPEHIKKYRIGLHEPGQDFKIQIVDEDN